MMPNETANGVGLFRGDGDSGRLPAYKLTQRITIPADECPSLEFQVRCRVTGLQIVKIYDTPHRLKRDEFELNLSAKNQPTIEGIKELRSVNITY
jgi:hypothetical protein